LGALLEQTLVFPSQLFVSFQPCHFMENEDEDVMMVMMMMMLMLMLMVVVVAVAVVVVMMVMVMVVMVMVMMTIMLMILTMLLLWRCCSYADDVVVQITKVYAFLRAMPCLVQFFHWGEATK
jgi:hypothetical protein